MTSFIPGPISEYIVDEAESLSNSYQVQIVFEEIEVDIGLFEWVGRFELD
jgi:hypothetical protein